MDSREFLFIEGEWRAPHGRGLIDVIDTVTEEVMGRVPAGDTADVDAAVRASVAAFPSWSMTSIEQRAKLLADIADALDADRASLAELMAREVGTPIATSEKTQVDLSISVFRSMAELIQDFPLEEKLGSATVVRVPTGVVAAITPWNYPLYQLAAKVAPALAAGCTVVVKPSSIAPLAAFKLADILIRLGAPRGIVNIVTGEGVGIGEDLVQHPLVDMVSLTGSVRAGARVGELAARDIKRVTLELGGKSAFILAPGADVESAVNALLSSAFANNGQTCSATTRLVVTRGDLDDVEQLIVERVAAMQVGDPLDRAVAVGPVASAMQRASIRSDVERGLPEGKLLIGGPEPMADFPIGYYVAPTVVSRLDNSAYLAREEVFGPVLSVIPVAAVAEAIAVANDSDFGLSGAVYAATPEIGAAIARRMRTGRVAVNGGKSSVLSPFGGFRKSGIGRELGPHGLAEYFELMALHLPA
ncbi:MAG: aldehyde dehydrogenase [Pseudonocardiales bacterium]|nr:aldehyde dehydrogenase [Pseudonocardiales bacterium]